MQQEFLRKIIAGLEAAGVTYAITGSIASNFWGIPRTTHDVDVVLVLAPQQARQFLGSFPEDLYRNEEAVEAAVATAGMFNVIDTAVGLKLDCWVSGNDPFSQSIFKRRRRHEMMPACEAYLASPEDVLLHKLVWNKITPSERQLADAAGIAAVQAGNLDLAYLRNWAAQQTTSAVLEEVLQGKYLKQT